MCGMLKYLFHVQLVIEFVSCSYMSNLYVVYNSFGEILYIYVFYLLYYILIMINWFQFLFLIVLNFLLCSLIYPFVHANRKWWHTCISWDLGLKGFDCRKMLQFLREHKTESLCRIITPFLWCDLTQSSCRIITPFLWCDSTFLFSKTARESVITIIVIVKVWP